MYSQFQILFLGCLFALGSGAIESSEPKLSSKLTPVNSPSYENNIKDLTASASDRSKCYYSKFSCTYIDESVCKSWKKNFCPDQVTNLLCLFFSKFSNQNLYYLGSSINLFHYRRLRFVTRFKQNFKWLTLIKRSFLEFYIFYLVPWYVEA